VFRAARHLSGCVGHLSRAAGHVFRQAEYGVFERFWAIFEDLGPQNDPGSPKNDGRPLAAPGVPETREYMLRGLVKDDEIGLDSDVARIAWSGS
jgi:hypothetical protein